MNAPPQPPTPHNDHAVYDRTAHDHAHFSPFSVLSGGIAPRMVVAGCASIVLWTFIAWALA